MSEPTSTPTPELPPAPTAFLFFKKIMLSTAFFVNGKLVGFDPLDQNIGLLKIAADDPVASALTAAASANGGRGRGGIVSITEQEAESLKKKLPFKPLALKSKRHVLQAFSTEPPALRPRSQNGRAAAAVSTNRISGRSGVGPVGGGGAGDESGKMPPVPAPSPAPPGEFVPATKRKSEIKMPVTKKASGRSLRSLAPDEPEAAPAE